MSSESFWADLPQSSSANLRCDAVIPDTKSRMADETKRLRELAQAATPGPWTRTTSGDPHWLREVRDARGSAVAWCGTNPIEGAHSNAAYIAAASPDVILSMADEIDRLRALLAEARETLYPPMTTGMAGLVERIDAALRIEQ